MKIKFESEYFKYAGKYRRYIMAGLLLAVCGLSYLFIGKYWQLGIVMGPVLSMGVISFMDFYIFSDTPVRRKQSAKSVGTAACDESATNKTAVSEAETIETVSGNCDSETATIETGSGNCDTDDSPVLIKALKQDLINKSVFSLLVMGFILVIVLFFTKKVNASRFFIVLCAGAVFAAGQLITRLTVLISRKLGTTFQRHSIIVYIALFICALILLPFVYLIKTNSKLLAVIFAVVLEALSVLAALLIIRTVSKPVLPKEEVPETGNSGEDSD